MHFGIDYGSKLAGTTVITYEQGGRLFQRSSIKGKDADQMILKTATELLPSSIYIDSPLSLPGAYFNKGNDYFYREADKKLQAMSPMFLGGLTARAMKLKARLVEDLGIDVFETYPGAFVRATQELKEVYDKKDIDMIPKIAKVIEGLIKNRSLEVAPNSIHAIDSLIAWYSGYRHINGKANLIGNPDEGVIIF